MAVYYDTAQRVLTCAHRVRGVQVQEQFLEGVEDKALAKSLVRVVAAVLMCRRVAWLTLGVDAPQAVNLNQAPRKRRRPTTSAPTASGAHAHTPADPTADRAKRSRRRA